MKFDEKKNIIEVCHFENFLAKYFIEHPEIFKPLRDKILKRIEALIKVNVTNQKFERILYSIFSFLYSVEPEVTDFCSFKKSSSLILTDHFLKRFAEIALIDDICLPLAENQDFLNHTYQPVFFKDSSLKNRLLKKIRPDSLFTPGHRGVSELDLDVNAEQDNSNFGILDEKHSSSALVNYFKFANFPSRLLFVPKENSNVALWLRKHYLPVICGTSGGIGYIVSHLSTFIDFSEEEYHILGVMLAASAIALGNHSFFEVMLPLSLVANPLEDKDTLLEFYEQTIPETIRRLPSYKEHMSSKYGAALIAEFNFNTEPCASL